LFEKKHNLLINFAQTLKDTIEEKIKMKGQVQEQGYFAKIVQRIIDNLQINIQDIHIRVESEFAPVQNLR
jgi:transcriptional regulatory protein LevR